MRGFQHMSPPRRARGRGAAESHPAHPQRAGTAYAYFPDPSRALTCPCGGGCPRCFPASLPLSRGDDPLELAADRTAAAALRGEAAALATLASAAALPGLRLHRDVRAARMADGFRADAFTLGTEVFFAAGRFQPESVAGQRLIAHELAHVAQQAHGAPRHIQREEQQPSAASSSSLAGEPAEARARRERLVRSISNAIENILRLLRTSGLLAGVETASERGGVRGVLYYAGSGDERFVSYTARDARLRRIVRYLIAMGARYRSAPIPATFAPPVRERLETGQVHYTSTHRYRGRQGPVTSSFGGGTPQWADLQGAYERFLVSRGENGDEAWQDWVYLDPESRIIPGAARGAPRIGHGIAIGIYLVVPDIDREPLHYWRLSGFSRPPPGSVIVELWADTFGEFYMHRGRRIDVPRRDAR